MDRSAVAQGDGRQPHRESRGPSKQEQDAESLRGEHRQRA